VERERRHPNVLYRVADERVLELLSLGGALLADNAEHAATCRRVEAEGVLMVAYNHPHGEDGLTALVVTLWRRA
jgi:hypothetical protein